MLTMLSRRYSQQAVNLWRKLLEAWDCHDWDNCPIVIAFNCHSLEEVPIWYRPRANQFVRLFDAGLIPKPKK